MGRETKIALLLMVMYIVATYLLIKHFGFAGFAAIFIWTAANRIEAKYDN